MEIYFVPSGKITRSVACYERVALHYPIGPLLYYSEGSVAFLAAMREKYIFFAQFHCPLPGYTDSEMSRPKACGCAANITVIGSLLKGRSARPHI